MKKLTMVMAAALVCALPATAGAVKPTKADKTSAAKQCRAERTAIGKDNFKAKYGTNKNKSNAFGKCVSKGARDAAAERKAARKSANASCKAEQQADPAAFATKYGTGKKHKNAFGKCVSQAAKAAQDKADAADQATLDAEKQCRAEQKLDPAAFKAKYGTNHNKKNAFGKCVSSKHKGTGEQG